MPCNFAWVKNGLSIKELKLDEAALVKKCLKGDFKAQELLYHQFAKKMMGVAFRYAGNEDDAKDILQEGFVKVFRFLKTFKAEGSLEGWIKRIVVNVALDHCKKAAKYATEFRNEHDVDLSDAEYEMLYKLEQEHLMCMIRALPEGFRIIFNLYALEGYSHKEIAVQLNISESTVRTQYIRAKKRLLEGIIVPQKIEKTG